MKSKIINISMRENIIDFICAHIDLGAKTAVISGGKRPFLFIKRKLALQNKKPFASPSFFTNDEFVENIVFENTGFVKIPDIESAFIIYESVLAQAPELLKGKKSFAEFMPWAMEILSFIEQTDLENISRDKLKNIQANAEIGYDVPENINNLLKNIFNIRDFFHRLLEKSLKITKGYSFIKAAEMTPKEICAKHGEYILLAPFYLHKTELEIYKKIYADGKLTVITQGDPNKYDSLKKVYGEFNCVLPQPYGEKSTFNLNVLSAYDDQSQAALLKSLINDLPPGYENKTAVIVPDEKLLQPVISEISTISGEYNVSAGYPASKTSIFALIKSIVDAQLSRKGSNYYVKDIIKVLSDPLVKNMRFFGDSSLSRITVHKIEQAFNQDSKNFLAGKLFVEFNEICANDEILKEISETVAGTSGYIKPEKLKSILEGIFGILFTEWEKPETLSGLADTLKSFIEKVDELSPASSYPLNCEAMEIIFSLSRQMKYGEVSKVKFRQEDMLKIFMESAENKKIPLPGSPLKGLQVIGLLESRNLSFENLYIVGMTDAALPAVKKESVLVPKDIMSALGIEMVKREYEIQNYHFNRIIAAAANLNLIYPENEKEERSRFIEKLVWQKQLEKRSLECAAAKCFEPSFFKPELSGIKKYEKTDEIKLYLKNMKYSYSKIDAYLRCRLEFYFRYVLGLDEKNEVGREFDGSDMGSFLHEFLQSVFCEGFKSETIRNSGFEEHFFAKLEQFFQNSVNLQSREDAFLIKKVLFYRMENFLKFEKERDYDTVFRCEKKYSTELETAENSYKLECIIDRIDKKNSDFLILDYKTGRTDFPLISKKFGSLTEGFKREKIKKAVKSLQLPLYKYIFEKAEGAKAHMCGIYNIKKPELFNLFSNIDNEAEVYEGCVDIIKNILDEISGGSYFEFDEKDNTDCKNCKFFSICR